MSELSNLFNGLYSQFVLRDLFGKIMPGFLLIMSIAISLTSLPETNEYLKSMSGWMWVVTGGISWIGGFIIQSFGESIKLFRIFPKTLSYPEFFHKLIQFEILSKGIQVGQGSLERFVVIKEACGNSYIAIIIASLILLLNALFNKSQIIVINSFQLVLIICTILFSIYFLGRMHYEHTKRQDMFIDTFIDEAKQPK